MASTSTAVTESVAFSTWNPARYTLFAVQAGVPTYDAMTQASCLLSVASSVLEQVLPETGSDAPHSAVYLIEMAQALVDASIAGQRRPDHSDLSGAEPRLADVLKKLVRFFHEGVFIVNPDADKDDADAGQDFFIWAECEAGRTV